MPSYSDFSSIKTFKTKLSPPIFNSPSNLIDTSINLNWQSISGITSYLLTIKKSGIVVQDYNDKVITGTTTSIFGLSQDSNYIAYLRYNSSNNTSDIAQQSFKTLVGITNTTFTFPTGIVPDLWFDKLSFNQLSLGTMNDGLSSIGQIRSQEGNNIQGDIYQATQNFDTSLKFNYPFARVQIASDPVYRSFGVNAKFIAMVDFHIDSATGLNRIVGASQYPNSEWALLIYNGQIDFQLLQNGSAYSRYIFNIVTNDIVIFDNTDYKLAVYVDLQNEDIRIILNQNTLPWSVVNYGDPYSYFATIADYKAQGGILNSGSIMYLGNGDSRHYDTQYFRGSIKTYAQFKTLALTESQIKDIFLQPSIQPTDTVKTFSNFIVNHSNLSLLYNQQSMVGSGLSLTDVKNNVVANFYKNTNFDVSSNFPSWVQDAVFGNGIKFNNPFASLQISNNPYINIGSKVTWLFLIKFNQRDLNQYILNKVYLGDSTNSSYQFYILPTNQGGQNITSGSNTFVGNTVNNVLLTDDVNVVVGLAIKFNISNHTITLVKNQNLYNFISNPSYTQFNNINTVNSSTTDLFVGSFLSSSGGYYGNTDLKAEVYGFAKIDTDLSNAQIKSEFAGMGLGVLAKNNFPDSIIINESVINLEYFIRLEMDEGTGTTVPDTSNNNNHAYFVRQDTTSIYPTWIQDPNSNKMGIDFSSTNGLGGLKILDSVTAELHDKFTLITLVKDYPSLNTNQIIIKKWGSLSNISNDAIIWDLENTDLRFTYYNGSSTEILSTPTIFRDSDKNKIKAISSSIDFSSGIYSVVKDQFDQHITFSGTGSINDTGYSTYLGASVGVDTSGIETWDSTFGFEGVMYKFALVREALTGRVLTVDEIKEIHRIITPKQIKKNVLLFTEHVRSNNSTITISNPDLTEKIYLTDGTYNDRFPRTSRDGNKIVFIRQWSITHADIFLMNKDGSNKVNITNFVDGLQAIYPDMSGDGTKIIFQYIDNLNNNYIYSINVDGTSLTLLYNIANNLNGYPRYSPDNKKILLGTQSGLEYYTLDTNVKTSILIGNAYFGDWHPTQNKVTYIYNGTGAYEIYMTDLDLNIRTQLTSLNASVLQFPTWSTDGNEIAFTFYQNSNTVTQLKKVNVNTLVVTDLTNDISINQEYSDLSTISTLPVSKEALLFVRNTNVIILQDIDKLNPFLDVTNDTSYTYSYPKFSNDYSKIIFVRSNLGIYDIFIRDLKSGINIPLGLNYSSPIINPLISPDNTKIVYMINESNIYKIKVTTISSLITSDFRMSTYLDIPVGWVDNSFLIINNMSNSSSTHNLIKSNGVSEVFLYSNNILENASLSHDKTKVIFDISTNGSKSNIAIYNLQTNIYNLLENDNSINALPSLSLNNSKVYFSSNRTSVSQIQSVTLSDNSIDNFSNNNLFVDTYPHISKINSPSTKEVIIFTRYISGYDQIFIQNANRSNNPVQLTFDLTNKSWCRFSKDYTKIIFTSFDSGKKNIWIININGSNQINLTSNITGDCEQPDISLDNNKIAYVKGSYIYVLNLTSNIENLVNTSDVYNFPANISRDDKIITQNEGTVGSANYIVKCDFDGSNRTPLVLIKSNGNIDAFVFTSNDSKWVAWYLYIDSSTYELKIADISLSSPVTYTITTTSINKYAKFSFDNKNLIFVSTRLGSQKLWKADITNPNLPVFSEFTNNPTETTDNYPDYGINEDLFYNV